MTTCRTSITLPTSLITEAKVRKINVSRASEAGIRLIIVDLVTEEQRVITLLDRLEICMKEAVEES